MAGDEVKSSDPDWVIGYTVGPPPTNIVMPYDLSTAEVTNYTERAEHGDANAANKLAGFFGHYGTSMEPRLYYLKKASDLGDRVATYNLAGAYEYSEVKRYKEAMAIYEDLARSNSTPAMMALAFMFKEGKGVEVSTNLAIAWFEKAAASGYIIGMEFAAELLNDQRETNRAYVWAKLKSIRGPQAHARNDTTLLDQISAKLAPDVITALNLEVEKKGKQIPVWTSLYGP